MSGLYLLALFALWLFVGQIVFRLWRRWKPAGLRRKILHIAIGMLFFSLWFGGAFWEVAGKKMYWDAKVRELCAKDGGIRVYETVELPADKFDRYGNVGIASKNAAKPTDKYYYEITILTLRKNNPLIRKTITQMIRRNDGKVLGELIRYGRGGGDFPGPWHPSHYSCPPIAKNQSGLEKSIFKKGAKK